MSFSVSKYRLPTAFTNRSGYLWQHGQDAVRYLETGLCLRALDCGRMVQRYIVGEFKGNGFVVVRLQEYEQGMQGLELYPSVLSTAL